MSKLPEMVYRDRITKSTQIAFGGLRHHEACADGELFDMENISTELYPIMSVRKGRGWSPACSDTVREIYADNGAFLEVDTEGLHYNGTLVNAKLRNDARCYFARFGDRVVLMPDKLLLNMKYFIEAFLQSKAELPEAQYLHEAYGVHDEDGHYTVWVWDGEQWVDNGWFDEPIELRKSFSEVTVKNGEIYGEKASANTIEVAHPYEYVTSSMRLKEGDAVKISGMSKDSRNNKLAIIREIAGTDMGTCEIRFSDNCFYIPDDAESYKEENVTLERTMPDVEFLFEHGNRLWGAKGKEIFASKLGDPRNWNVFEGLASDCWYLEVQSKGTFTGGISYGYPRFFKEDSLLTIYGTAPASFQTNEQKLLGLSSRERESLGEANGLLFWISERGPVIFDGSAVRLQDQIFGEWKLTNAVGKGAATKYYLSADIGQHPMEEYERLYAIFCYDTQRGMWTKENAYDAPVISMTTEEGKILALVEGKKEIVILNGEGKDDQMNGPSEIESYAEFGDFYENSPNRKALSKLQLRLEVEDGASLRVYISYDGRPWLLVKTIQPGSKRSLYLPVIPHRCDYYRIRLEGHGQWRLYSMSREYYIGSEIH